MERVIKNFIITLAFLLAANVGASQQVRFAVHVDPQLSWFNSDTKAFSRNGTLFGFNAGFALERYFADRYAIATGASITNTGGIAIFNNSTDTIRTLDGHYTINKGESVKVKGQYFSVPLGLKFKSMEIGYTTVYAEVGLRANVRLKGYVWADQLGEDREVLDSKHMYFGYISYYFGAGVQYSLGGPTSLLAGLTYSDGLTPPLRDSYKVMNIGSLALKLGIVF